MNSNPFGRLERFVLFAALALGGALFVFSEAVRPGIAWDEPFYLAGGLRHVEWLFNLNGASFEREALDYAWGINHEHPPLAKIGFGLGASLFGSVLGPLVAARLFSVLAFGVLEGALFVLLSRWRSRCFAWLTVFFVACMPRFLGYASIGYLDFPLAALWTGLVLAFYRAREKRIAFFWGAAIFAAMNLTKFNGAFALVPLAVWGIVFDRRRVALRMLLLAAAAVICLAALWPWLYRDPFYRLGDYLANKTGRVLLPVFERGGEKPWILKKPSRVPVFYLKEVYRGERYPAPWHYAPLLFAATVPVAVLLCALAGIARVFRAPAKHPLGMLCAINLAWTVGVWCLPFFPRYGGTRFLLPAYPSAALLAALGLEPVFHLCAARRSAAARAAAAGLTGLVLTASLVPVLRSRGAWNCYFNEAVLAAGGADETGLPFENVGAALSGEAVAFVNRTLPPGARLCLLPLGRFAVDLHRELGTFREDIRLEADRTGADWAVLLRQPEFFDATLREWYAENKAAWSLRASGAEAVRVLRLQADGSGAPVRDFENPSR